MRLFLASGKIMDLTNIQPEDINLQDIAHQLAHICRWNGATPRHYSVAEHCVLVSDTLNNVYAKAGLLHDAHETYQGDVTRPIQEAIDTTDIRYLKRYLNTAIGKRFYIDPKLLECKEVTLADNFWLNIEGALFFEKWPRYDHIDYKLQYPKIKFLSPAAAKKAFLERFEYVQGLHV